MAQLILQNSDNLAFGARIRLSDKQLLQFSHNNNLLKQHSSMDCFFKNNRPGNFLSTLSESLRGKIREHQRKLPDDEASFMHNFYKNLYAAANYIRAISSKLFLLMNYRNVYKTDKFLNNNSKNSRRYIDEWAKLGNSLPEKFIDINIEDGRLEELARSGRSSIFILNHDNIQRDKFIYPIFNSFLNYGYAACDRQAVCPRPILLVSQNVMKFAGAKLAKLYEKMGLRGINATLSEYSAAQNIFPFFKVVKDFIKGKVNIFIYPEGNNSIYKNKTLREKFQDGTAKIILTTLKQKPEVRVVPLGLAYGNLPNHFGSINIGNSIFIRNIKDKIFARTPETEQLFLGKISDKDTVQNINNLLCDRLEISVKKSRQELAE